MVFNAVRSLTLSRPASRALPSRTAYTGAVVSKPTAATTTVVLGALRAMSSASRGEYTGMTAAPPAFASSSDSRLPLTPSMSQKQTTTCPGRLAQSIRSSM